MNRRAAAAALERDRERKVPAFRLRGEHLAEHDFQIKEPRRVASGTAKLCDNFPARSGERLRVRAINGPA